MKDFIDFAFVLIVIACVIAGVQWLLLRFTNWSVALAATGVVSFIIAVIYVSLKNATPNGGSNGPTLSEFVTPTLIIFIALFCGFLLVCYFTQYQLPKIAFVLPLSLVAVFVIGHYGYQEVHNMNLYYSLFSNCELEVVNEADSTSNLQEIVFKNTSSGIVVRIEPSSKAPSVSQMLRFADRIFFRTNSAKSNRLETKEFPFDYSICQETQRKGTGLFFWIPTTETLPMRIVLQPDEKADLYVGGNFIKQYQFSDSDSLKTE